MTERGKIFLGFDDYVKVFTAAKMSNPDKFSRFPFVAPSTKTKCSRFPKDD